QVLARAPPRLIDIKDPADPYSAAQFCIDARRAMAAMGAAGQIPLLVGGTGLYFQALTQGLTPLPGADANLRHALDVERRRRGLGALHERLGRLDPAAAARIHPHDTQRIIRALELCLVSGRPATALYGQTPTPVGHYRFVKIALAPAERQVLHRRIEARFRSMLERGLIQEVQTLRQRGDLTLDTPAMRAVGYRQVWEYLDGYGDVEELHRRGTVATRQFAKRQLTWLRRDSGLTWLENGANTLDNSIEVLERESIFST
ncbi:MAG: tRNA (adenosine(37)-N6)-dimethylallyltransferase MiaA, partial [Candidatus Competibacterales bacterium]